MSDVVSKVLGQIDVCSMCGDPIPEGRQVCPICADKIDRSLNRSDPFTLKEEAEANRESRKKRRRAS